MNIPGLPSLFLLAYLLVLLPWLARRSAQVMHGQPSGGSTIAIPPRETIWKRTLLAQLVLLLVSWGAGRSFGFDFIATPPITPRLIAAGLVALVLALILRQIARALHSEAERRSLAVYKLAPRTPREWALCVLTVFAAAIAEELAYRGVLVAILGYMFQNTWLAIILSAIAFAAAHWMQGWKSGLVIYALALLMHALVAYTGTLLVAMLVHAAYDLVAGYLIAKQAQHYDREAIGGAA